GPVHGERPRPQRPGRPEDEVAADEPHPAGERVAPGQDGGPGRSARHRDRAAVDAEGRGAAGFGDGRRPAELPEPGPGEPQPGAGRQLAALDQVPPLYRFQTYAPGGCRGRPSEENEGREYEDPGGGGLKLAAAHGRGTVPGERVRQSHRTAPHKASTKLPTGA